MKKYTLTLMYFVLMTLIIGCDKKITVDEKKQTVMEEKTKSLVGGWKTSEVNDKIKEIANFVVTDKTIKSKVLKISDASVQVVSGRNFSFKLHLENGEVWNAKVYENIKKEKKVTLFEKLN